MDIQPDASTARSRLYPPSPPESRKIRVVALVGHLSGPTWIAEALAAIVESDVAELLVVAAVAAPPPPRFPYLLEALLRFDALLGGIARMVTVGCSLPGRLPETMFIACGAASVAPQLMIAEPDLARLAALRPDLVVTFGLPPADVRLGAIATHGVWSFDRYADDPIRSALWLLRPIMRGCAVTQGGLVVHMTDDGARHLLQPLQSATSQLSFARNRANQLLRVPALLVRALRGLARGAAPTRHPAPDFAVPGNVAMLLFGARFLIRALRRQLPRLGQIESWFIAIRRGETRIDPANPELGEFKRIEAPAGYFWADPCSVIHEGRAFVFVEEYVYATRRGRIAAIELDDGISPMQAGTVLEAPWHLSYPCLFEWDGAHYMTVESSESQSVSLYRAQRFPDRWDKVADLLRGWNIVDPTLHFDGTRWYLFATVKESALSYDERIWDDLFLFFADTPLGPWQPHPMNPIVSDVRAARPAGRLFAHEGRLIRPSQDCSFDYGYAVVFNEVTALGVDTYAETTIGRIEPRWAARLKGCHTYSVSGDLEVLDAKILIEHIRAHTHTGTHDELAPANPLPDDDR